MRPPTCYRATWRYPDRTSPAGNDELEGKPICAVLLLKWDARKIEASPFYHCRGKSVEHSKLPCIWKFAFFPVGVPARVIHPRSGTSYRE